MDNYMLLLESLNAQDREFVTSCNRLIRRYRNMTKEFGDEDGFNSHIIHSNMQQRRKAKDSIARRSIEIARIQAKAA